MSPAARMLLMTDLAACVVAIRQALAQWGAANVVSGRRQHPDVVRDVRAWLAVLRARGPLTGTFAPAWAAWADRLAGYLANFTADATPAEFAASRDGRGAPTVQRLPPTWN